MVTNEQMLRFFRAELITVRRIAGRRLLLELDTSLQDYAEGDELIYAIDKYDRLFQVDVSLLNLGCYYPWKTLRFFHHWFRTTPLQCKKSLTVRMFAESARAGRWLYD